ncbi:MAG: PKD domain-containing protein [Candidatus Diapherotrites archaeon]
MKKTLLVAFFFFIALSTTIAAKQVSLKAGTAPPYSEADTEPEALVLQGVPGLCYDLKGEIQNNISSTKMTKDLDLVFILDASGSMQDEIDAVKNSIVDIMAKINSDCPGCMRVGIYVFEGVGSNRTGFTPKPAYCGYSAGAVDDVGAIHLGDNSLLIKNLLGQVKAGGSGWLEPWCALTKDVINDSSFGWRNSPDVVPAILVITDEPADSCTGEATGYRCTEAGQALLNKNAYFFGIIGSGSYEQTVINDMDTILGIAKKGNRFKYGTNSSQIPDLILKAIYSIIGSDTFKVERVSGENWGGILQGTSIVQSTEIKDVPRDGKTATFLMKICPPLTYSQPEAKFQFRLSLKDDPAIYDDAWVKIVLNQPPKAKIKALTATNGIAPLTVQMDASLSTDPQGDADMKSFEWDCTSDGTKDFTTTTKTAIVSCVYSAKNTTYSAKLTVTDTFGAKSTDSLSIVTLPNVPPQIHTLSYSPQTTHPQEDTTFTALPADPTKPPDPDGTIVKYTWVFGDGTTTETTTNTVVHKYTAKGTFFATVTVTDNDGATSTSAILQVIVENRKPNKPVITAIPTSGFVPLIVQFTGTAVDPDGDQIVGWIWDFDGDGIADAPSPCNCPSTTKTYTVAGTFNARAKAQDNDPTKPLWSEWSDPITGITAIQNSISAFRVNDTNEGQKTKAMVSCTSASLTAIIEIRNKNGELLKQQETPCNGAWIEPDLVFEKSGIYEARATIKDGNCANCPKTIYFRAVPQPPELKIPDAMPFSALIVLAMVLFLVEKKKKK